MAAIVADVASLIIAGGPPAQNRQGLLSAQVNPRGHAARGGFAVEARDKRGAKYR